MKWLRDIWEFDTWIIKFFLLSTFVFNLGLPQGCTRVMVEDYKNRQPAEIRMFQSLQLNHFMKKRVEVAEQKMTAGEAYTPYDYFEDLKQCDLKTKELGTTDRCQSEIDRLMWLMQSGIDKTFGWDDIEKAKKIYIEFIDPGRVPRENFQKEVKALGWGGVLVWFFWLYLKTIPVVLVLYLIWMRDERHQNSDYGSFKFPKPGRFLLLLVGYPFVLGYFIIRWWILTSRKAVAEAELRRSKRLFAYISEEDLEKIKRFAKSNLSLSEWRKQLQELGLKHRHSLASALLVSLMFVFFIRPLEAGTKQVKNFAGNLALEQITSSQSLPRMSINEDKKIQPEKSSWPWERPAGDVAVQFSEFIAALACSFLPRNNYHKPINKFIQEIFHVPLLAVGFELKLQITHC